MLPDFYKDSHSIATVRSLEREQELYESWWELTSESLYQLYESFLNSRIRSNENKNCMRVDEIELTSESLYESFLNSHALVKRQQELYESWWKLTSESLYESFLNCQMQISFAFNPETISKTLEKLCNPFYSRIRIF